jgi:hypothetical protein
MGITSNDIAAQRAMLQRGEEKRKADWKQAERERLRDTFAAAALTGLMQFTIDAATPGAYVKSTAAIAANAYDIADAMLRERERQSDRLQPVTPADATPDTNTTPTEGSVQNLCTLTVEEREAIENMLHLIATKHEDYGKEAYMLRSLLERLPTS